MDVGTHLRAIWRRPVMVFGGALTVGLVVLLLRSVVPATYTSTAVMFVVPDGAETRDVAGEVRRLTATYSDLVFDSAVLRDASVQTGVPVEQAGRRTTVPESDDGQLHLTATGPTASASASLANAMATSLAAAADRDQAEDLRRDLAPLDAELQALAAQARGGQLSGAQAAENAARQAAVFEARLARLGKSPARLQLVSAARPALAERSPNIARDTILATLLALIVLSELAALQAARRKGLEGRDAVPTLASWTQLPVFRVGWSKRGPDQSVASLLHARSVSPHAADRFVLAVAPLAPPDALDATVQRLLRAGVVVHGGATLLDLRTDAATAATARGDQPWETVRPSPQDVEAIIRGTLHPEAGWRFTLLVADEWDSPEFLVLARELQATTVVAVDAGTVREPELRERLTTLRRVQADPVAVLVLERPGRRLLRAFTRLAPGDSRPSPDIDTPAVPADPGAPASPAEPRPAGSAVPAATAGS